ncbi:hypothetical protein AB0G75_34015, partial [Streptomyces longwoodensis]
WGAPAEREYEGWDWLRHEAGQVWEGIWTDGVIGTIHGVGTLFGSDGSHAAGEAWKNLAKLGTASALTSATFGMWWLVPEDEQPTWLRESREAHKGMVKGLVAWDTWQTNPARAAGAVTFNVLTILGTEGAGTAARTGAAARTLSVVGKVGRAIDPMTYAGKAGGFALGKVGETFRSLRNLQAGTTLDLLERADAMRSPKVPDSAIPYVDDTGKLVYLTDEGHLLNADGTLHQHADEAAREVSAADRSEMNGVNAEAGSGAHRIPVHAESVVSKGDGTHQAGTDGSTFHDPGGSHDGFEPRPGSPASHGGGNLVGGDHDATPPLEHAPSEHGGPNGEGSLPPEEMTPAERALHDELLHDLAERYRDDFDEMKQDPDHKGKVKPSEMDEARVALDLRESRKVPADIQRPPGANQGDLYSPSTGTYYDIKGVHSDWPPLNNVRDKSLPFKGAYDPANNQTWVRKLADQIETKRRVVILDMRNANQAAIDDVRAIVAKHGWSDRVVWYP